MSTNFKQKWHSQLPKVKTLDNIKRNMLPI